MIKSHRGEVEAEGTPMEILADLSVLIMCLHEEMSGHIGEKLSEKHLREAFDDGILGRGAAEKVENDFGFKELLDVLKKMVEEEK